MTHETAAGGKPQLQTGELLALHLADGKGGFTRVELPAESEKDGC